jgi:predicted aspartyl protease
MVRITAAGTAGFRCLLDTGADGLAIPYRTMQILVARGLRDNDWMLLGPVQSRVAGGGRMQGAKIVMREIDIGPWALYNVHVTVIPAGNACSACRSSRSLAIR